jgi:hypothetical protein
MKQKSGPNKAPAEQVLKDIRRQTRRQYSAEEKIRIVLEGLRGEENISELCRREGGLNTASGERYDPFAWAAAIKTNLRKKFGGVQFGARPKYALVEAAGKKAIIKINDVGPLTPDRIIDFNEPTMRHFDPSLRLGVIYGVKVTPLSGDDWTPGPIA